MRISIVLLALTTSMYAGTAEDLDRYVTARTQLGQFSGAVLVAHEGKVLLRKGYGYANLEHLVPNTPETKFEIASLTKAFTAFATDDLARAGKLNLSASVCDYVTPCPDAWKAVTVAHLIHHRSGITDYESTLEMGSPAYYANLTQPKSVAAMIDWARARPLDFPPGSKFNYSNTAYLLLGTILEKVSGKTYEALLRERICAPLGMTRTSHIDRERVERDRAEGYSHQAPLEATIHGIALTSEHFRHVPQLRQDPPQADGGLLSTVDDLYKWAHVFTGESVLAGRTTVDALLTPVEEYAAGWFVTTANGRRKVSHTGILPGMVSGFDIFPESRTVILWLGNMDRIRVTSFKRDLTSIVFGEPYDIPQSRDVRPIDAAHAAPLVGDYKLADGRVMKITHAPERGWLTAEVKDQFTAGLLPVGEHVFYAPMWENTLTISPDGKSLVMRNAGKDLMGTRMATIGR